MKNTISAVIHKIWFCPFGHKVRCTFKVRRIEATLTKKTTENIVNQHIKGVQPPSSCGTLTHIYLEEKILVCLYQHYIFLLKVLPAQVFQHSRQHEALSAHLQQYLAHYKSKKLGNKNLLVTKNLDCLFYFVL